MKTTKRTLWKLLIVCVALMMSIGGTIAYLTDTDGDVNVMTLGRVEIDLIEQERTENGLGVFQDDHPLIPGVYPGLENKDENGFWPESVHNAVDKIVSVKNTGPSDAYVRLWFAFEVTGEQDFFEKMIHLNLNKSDGWDWDFLDGILDQGGEQYAVAVATYANVLQEGGTTPVSLRQVLLDSSATNEIVAALGEKYNILVVAQGVQASGFTSADAALNSGFGAVDITNHPFTGMTTGESYVTVTRDGLDKVLNNRQMGGKDNVVGVTFGRVSEYDVLMEGIKDKKTVQEAQSGARNILFATAYAEDESGVTAYYVPSGEKDGETLYHVYILTEGEIKLHKDCEQLMGDFGNLTVFAATNLDASDVEQMQNFYKGCTNLTVVTVPDGVTIIPEEMFAGCEKLEVIEIPGTVTQINENAFNSKKDTVYLIVEKGSAAEEWGNNKDGYQTTNVPFTWWNMGDYIHITKYIGTAAEVVVPAEIDGLPVEVLGSNAFAALEHMDIVTSVQLPDTLRRADYGVFIDCNKLRTINIPASLKHIPEDFLCMCKSLESITIPEGVVRIESGAFSACDSLTSVSLPRTLTHIAYDAFRECDGLEKITIPYGVEHIGSNAFSNTRIKELTLPSTVTWLGDSAFAGMNQLQKLTIPSSVTHFGDDCLPTGVTIYVKEGSKAEAYCKENGLAYTWTDGTSFGPSAPSGSPDQPDTNPADAGNFIIREMDGNIIQIEGYNDEESPLVNLTVPAWLDEKRVRVIGSGAFPFKKHLKTAVLSEGVWEIKYTAFASCERLTSVKLPNSINSIGRDAFSSCAKLVEINIPTGITAINENTFRDCSSLPEITIPGNVRYIEREAFANCSGLQEVTISEGVQSLAEKVFAGCPNLLEINIPKSVTSIGEGVFDGCRMVQVKVYQNTAGHRYCEENGIPYHLFDEDENFIQSVGQRPEATPTPQPPQYDENFEYHEWTDEVPFNWYRTNDEIVVGQYEGVGPEVVFPSYLAERPVKVLRLNTFSGMKYIKKVTLPDTLTTIEGWVFPGANNMTECDIPAGVTSIGDGTFFECYALQSVTIPAGVTEILPNTFGQCWALTSVTIPGNVKTLHQQAFHDCIGLTSIEIKDGVETIGAEAFAGCNSLESITIPASVIKMEPNIFSGCGAQVVATVYENSVAHTYCETNGIRCKVLDADGKPISTLTPTPTPTPTPEPTPDSGEGGEGGETDFDLSQCNIQPDADFPFYAMKYAGNGVQLYKYDATKNATPNGVTIPDEVDGEKVITLHTGVFKDEQDLKSVTLSRNMQYVGSKAFDNCPNLAGIYTYGGVFFESDALSNCPNAVIYNPPQQ